MTGPKNIDRSLKRMARKHAVAAKTALRNIRLNKTAMSNPFVREHVIGCQYDVDHLIMLIAEKCRHCGERVDFGIMCCPDCADERGP